MFDDYTEELESSWNNADVIEWKEKARGILKDYYLAFGERQWDEYNMPHDRDLLRAKVCYALFGPPSAPCDETTKIEDAYEHSQKEQAQKIVIKLMDSKICHYNGNKIQVGIIFVACRQKVKQRKATKPPPPIIIGESIIIIDVYGNTHSHLQGEDAKQFVIPIFSVFGGLNTQNEDLRRYVDTQGRTYKSWNDWEKTNTLPMLKYAYPTRGFFTCSQDISYKFDPNCYPDIKFGNSPRCNRSQRFLNQADVGTAFISLGTGLLFGASLITPIGPAVLLGSAIAGSSCALYGAGRGVGRLVDKSKHGESLKDFEAVTLWLGLAATPFHFATSAMNTILVRGATINGRIFSSSTRMFVTILNFTTLGLDAGLMISGIVNMSEKYKNGRLTPLDCLQFSMSVFFFSHTLIQPKVASGIIEKAQNQHIELYKNNLSDADAQSTFQKLLDQNKGGGTITDKSKIVRTINRIQDPNGFFKDMKNAQEIKIGGRKGKTVLVTDNNGHINRLNPNQRILYEYITQKPAEFQKVSKKLQKCFGQDNLDDIKLNGKKIFKDLNDRDKKRVRKVFEPQKYDPDIAGTSLEIAELMNCQTADEFMSITEIVIAEVKGKQGADLTDSLNYIKRSGRDPFINQLRADLKTAMECAQQTDLKFSDPLKAVYHYRKHGADFPTKILSNKLEFYIGNVPNKIIQDSNLVHVQNLKGGVVRKLYVTPTDNFGIVTETCGKRNISSLYRCPNIYTEYMQKLDAVSSTMDAFGYVPVDVTASNLAQCMGYASLEISVAVQGSKAQLYGTYLDIDASQHEEIALQLAALLICMSDD